MDPKEDFGEAYQLRLIGHLSEDPYDTPEYQAFVEEMAKHCHCEPLSRRPCDGVLAGGMCDGARDEREDLVEFEDDDEPQIP